MPNLEWLARMKGCVSWGLGAFVRLAFKGAGLLRT